MENDEYRVDILFPDEYSDFIAEIYFGEKFVCLVTQDPQGKLLIEFPNSTTKFLGGIPLEGLLATLEKVRERLVDLR